MMEVLEKAFDVCLSAFAVPTAQLVALELHSMALREVRRRGGNHLPAASRAPRASTNAHEP